MTIEIKSLTLGLAVTNCYLLGDSETGEAILIDPVDNAELLHETAHKAGWTVKLILATHGHFDHVLASKRLKELTGAPFYIHENGQEWLDQLPAQGLMFTGRPFPEAAKPDRLLPDEGDPIEVGSIRLEPIYTPGHSHDHLSFYLPSNNLVFSGDCLFFGSIGRTDLPYGDHDLLMESITTKLLPLGDDVRVYPGHMETTSIGYERKTNPFILDYLKQKP